MADPRTKTTVRVDNLHPALTEDNLRDQFIAFGEIVDVEISANKREEDQTMYAHIEFEDPVDAAAALDNMDSAELYDQVIRVTPAKAIREAFEGLGSKVPLWEQEGFIQKYMVEDNGQGGDAMQGLERNASQGNLPVSVGPMPSK